MAKALLFVLAFTVVAAFGPLARMVLGAFYG